MPELVLNHNPYLLFQTSPSPMGLYARQKWLGQTASPSWRHDFEAAVRRCRAGQKSNGLWHGSSLETIQRLFDLHLTVRDADPDIDRALDALLAAVLSAGANKARRRVAANRLAGLPFAPGRWMEVVGPATVFLAAIFGRDQHADVVELIGRLNDGLLGRRPEALPHAAGHNGLRAFVVLQNAVELPATRLLVAWMARRQTTRGDWGRAIPFFQGLNALAHLDLQEARHQCARGFDLLVATQNPDGSWGTSQREACSFLAIHALRNQGMI